MSTPNPMLRMNAGKSPLVAKTPATGMVLFVQGRNDLNLVVPIAPVLIAALVALVVYIATTTISTGPSGGTAPKTDAVPMALHAASGDSDAPGAADSLTIFWDRRRISGPMSAAHRRKIRRTRAEIRQERRQLLEKTNREIDAIVAEFHEKMPREQARGIGSLYARYSSRFQDSLADQIRTLFEAAYKLGIFIPRENVFFDLAVRGYQDRRPGLAALQQAIEQRQFDTLLIFSTNRLFRRTYKALQFVEEQIVERGFRAIFLKTGIDTADGDNWRTTFQLFAAFDEAVVRMYGAHVRAAHEGLFLRRMVCTSLPLGYTGEEVPGEETKRKRPRRRIIVDPENRQWIEKIYAWYVHDRLGLGEIARLLNDDDNAPAPAKSLTGLWTHALVRKHLINPCYRGFWAYGVAETKWSSDKDYAKHVLRPEPLKSGQFEELRIVPDEIWYAAQKRLAEEVTRSGRKPKDPHKSLPNLLRAMFFCPEHGRQLVVGGANASILYCPVCRGIAAEQRPLFSHLNRQLALRLTCEKLAELVRLDDDLVHQIIVACQQEADVAQRADPEAERQLRAKLDKLRQTVDFNRRNPGETDEEQAATTRLLKQLNGERAALEAELSGIEAAKNRVITPPSPDEVFAMLAELGDLLTQAVGAGTDAQLGPARRIIELLTGGRIELFQQGERKARQGWLQGRFRIRLLSFLIERVTGVRPLGADYGVEVVIDYREPPEFIALSEKAKALYDTGMMNAQIAKELGVARNYVTKLLKHWFESRGLVMPDGRSRRASLKQKHLESPLYQQIADDVMALYEQDTLLQDIADTLGVDRNTVTAAIRWWHEVRGLPVPDGRTRRKSLDIKTSPKGEDAGPNRPNSTLEGPAESDLTA